MINKKLCSKIANKIIKLCNDEIDTVLSKYRYLGIISDDEAIYICGIIMRLRINSDDKFFEE